MLLDSGNFVFKELDSNGSTERILWQSFDYPTDDTLLPGMKPGMNLKTGHFWSLTSRISESIPAEGSFFLIIGVGINGSSQLIIWWKRSVYWTSGVWQNEHFELLPVLSNEGYGYHSCRNKNDQFLKPSAWTIVLAGHMLSSPMSAKLVVRYGAKKCSSRRKIMKEAREIYFLNHLTKVKNHIESENKYMATPTPEANFEAAPPGTDRTGIFFRDQLWLKSDEPSIICRKLLLPLPRGLEKIGYVDTENKGATLESKVTKETIDFKEVKRVDHILAFLQRKWD
ncbi:hypothetical protein EZV62_028105 [Acer yangbiense]|uniref:Bulb-type lectin domain-containing protein n=1 Tax=Acer yangbiense TaxID=1000413 RepID=A0A5C7GQ00_9ROSI|nr:hypothetical protein EZV62_028105 [Acer yangbiense]